MKTLASLLIVAAALASQPSRVDAETWKDGWITIQSQSSPIVGQYDVEIGDLAGQNGTIYVVVYGSRDADPGQLIAKQRGSAITADVDRDGFRDLVLQGTIAAVADVNGDGTLDIITSPGPGGGPHVVVFSYDPGFRGGVYVAAGDVDGDGFADIIVGADFGR